MRRSIFVVAAVLILSIAMNAKATPISFVETGTASGLYHGTVFTNLPFVITGSGDTALRHWDPWLGGTGSQIDLITSSITIGGFEPISFPSNYTQFMVRQGASSVIFNVVGHDAWTMIAGPVSDLFATWDMSTSIGPITGNAIGGFWHPQYGNIVDQIMVGIYGPVTFTATVADSQPIPEPGTLALVGGGIFAFAVYRKRMRKV